MINKLPIFEATVKGKKNYFFLKEEQELTICSGCGEIIKEPAGLFCYWLSGKQRDLGIYHFACKSQIPKKVVYKETGIFTFINKRFPNAYPVIFGSKSVISKNNNLTVFEASEIPSPKTNNKTVYAGRESLEGATVGLMIEKKEESPEELLNQIKGSQLLGERDIRGNLISSSISSPLNSRSSVDEKKVKEGVKRD